jgi:hypothetical protein
MPDGQRPQAGGWNRFQLVVGDLAAEVARLRTAGLRFRNDIVTGPIELFQPPGVTSASLRSASSRVAPRRSA